MISPQDIQTREFKEAFRGYRQDEVDTFLDEIAEEFGRLYQENQRLLIANATAQQEAGQRGALPPDVFSASASASAGAGAMTPERAEAREEMKRALVATQRAAEAALDEAKRRGAEILARAEQRAKEIDQMTARRAGDIDGDAASALTYAQQRVEELKQQESEIRARLRRMLTEHVKMLQSLEGEPRGTDTTRRTAQPPAPGAGPGTSVTQPGSIQPPASPRTTPSASTDVKTGGASVAQNGSVKGTALKNPSKGVAAKEHDPMWLGAQRTAPPIGNAGRNGTQDSSDRAAVVQRMTRELGDAAAPGEVKTQRTKVAPRDAFWK